MITLVISYSLAIGFVIACMYSAYLWYKWLVGDRKSLSQEEKYQKMQDDFDAAFDAAYKIKKDKEE